MSLNGLLHAFMPAAFSDLAMLGAPAAETPIGAKAARKPVPNNAMLYYYIMAEAVP